MDGWMDGCHDSEFRWMDAYVNSNWMDAYICEFELLHAWQKSVVSKCFEYDNSQRASFSEKFRCDPRASE